MPDAMVIHGLRHKKSRLLGQKKRLKAKIQRIEEKLAPWLVQIDQLRTACEEINEQVEVLSSTLTELGSDPSATAVKDCAKWSNGKRRGAFLGALIDALADKTRPHSTAEISLHIACVLNLDLNLPNEWRNLRRQTNAYLWKLERASKVEKIGIEPETRGVLWRKV